MGTSEWRELSRIGEVAEHLGVSPRTIKYYEELGLVAPRERSPGGFRLYGAADVDRLERVLRLKAMGFSLAAIREFLAVRDAAQEATREEILAETTVHLRERERDVAARIEKAREDLKSAEALRRELRRDIALCERRMRELRDTSQ
jgi:MerR family transcriptional regulator, repressor of the yfmOP operon